MLTLQPSHWLALAVVLTVALLTLWPLARLRLRHRRHDRRPGRPPGPPLSSLAAMQAEHEGRIKRDFVEARRCADPRRAPWEKATRSR